jgi:hypothetical protein
VLAAISIFRLFAKTYCKAEKTKLGCLGRITCSSVLAKLRASVSVEDCANDALFIEADVEQEADARACAVVHDYFLRCFFKSQ